MAPTNSTLFDASSSESGSQAVTASTSPTTISPITTDSPFSPLSCDSNQSLAPFARSLSLASCKSKEEILALIIEIAQKREPSVINFSNIPAPWGPAIFASLEEEDDIPRCRKTWNSREQVLSLKVPTPIHNCIQRWWAGCVRDWEHSGQITRAESDLVDATAGTTITLPHSPFAASRKEPDLLIQPDGEFLPSVVIEAGWSEPSDALEADYRFRGATVWQLDEYDQPVKRQTEVIFPDSAPRGILFTRGELSREALDATRDPGEVLRLDIGLLRQHALFALGHMGLQPAQ
ncbi:hypothetical protein N7535_009516 [Penicillium sp. DV-2018c]|nr:hypothetical protein N7461_001997 [Penicillium sp. DV-2018c]KAJ5559288.1 hypothetical protein N7535_009516 [Penicillium sp. DV-2018c]